MADIPHIRQLSVHGFRGFGAPETLEFAVPNGNSGSGLTIITGPNNAGKSSIVEAIMAVTQIAGSPTFSERKRNKDADDRVRIVITDGSGNSRELATVPAGGSETSFQGNQINPSSEGVYVLPSRRNFRPFFSKTVHDRRQYISGQQALPETRTGQSNFEGRIFRINNDPDMRQRFETVLSEVLEPVPDWIIDQADGGNYFLKYTKNGHSHTSDGLGEGLLNVFFIVDALYDSEPGSMIVIDEPELSLHPQLQAKVSKLFHKYSADRQIVISTHSPKFIDWPAIVEGASIVRTSNETGSIRLHHLSEDTKAKISGLMRDLNNPHVLGLDAGEVFFLSDKVVLVEGQEDVLFYPKVLADTDTKLSADFYGWGVGGADKMPTIASILNDLGFRKVVGILDNNKADSAKPLSAEFPDYHFVVQPADDIRYKSDRDGSSLLDDKNVSVRDEFRKPVSDMFAEIEKYLSL